MYCWQRVVFNWRLRRLLKRKAATARALTPSSGLLEWSDREIARLKPSWVRHFIRHQRTLARLLERVALATLVLASTFFALSLERFWVGGATAQAVLREEKQVITKVQAWNVVKKPKPLARPGGPAGPAPTPLPAKYSREAQARLRVPPIAGGQTIRPIVGGQ